MKIKQITDVLESLAPKETAEEWDRVGLMLGSENRDCTGVLVALDLTSDVAAQAVKQGLNLIVTHHPFLFKPLSEIDLDAARGAIIETLIKNDVTVYAAHTNLDKARGGLCWKLAELFGGENIAIEELGAVFEMKTLTLERFAKKVGLTLADRSVKVVGNPDADISRVYVVSGGGGDTETYLRAKAVADVLVTGDIKHHIYVEAVNDGFPLVEFSHYKSEIIVQELLCDLLEPCCGDIKIIKANQQCPYRILEEL